MKGVVDMYFVDDAHKQAFQGLAQSHSGEGDYLAAYYIMTSGEWLRNISLPHIDKYGSFNWRAIQNKYKNLGSTHRRMAQLAYHLFGGNGKVDLTTLLGNCDAHNATVIQQAIGVWYFRNKG